MKRLLLFNLVLVLAGLNLFAQDRSIQFIHAADMNWENVLAQARKEHKMIFIDCYTSWCGPCKRLAKEIFTQNDVADFYNAHFINIKYDVEKDPKFAMRNPFPIYSYPTLLYLSEKGDVVHALMGAYTAEITLANGQKAIDPENNLISLIKRYDAGERSKAFMRKYAEAAKYSSRPNADKITVEYLNSLNDQEFYTQDSWKFIDAKRLPLLSAPVLRAIGNKDKFTDILGEKEVNDQITYFLLNAVSPYMQWHPKKAFNETKYTKLHKYLSENITLHPQIPSWISSIEAAYEQYKGDYQSILKRIGEATEHNVCPSEFIRRLSNCPDKKVKEECIRMLDDITKQPEISSYTKACSLKCKVSLLKQLGQTEESQKTLSELEQYARTNKINIEKL